MLIFPPCGGQTFGAHAADHMFSSDAHLVKANLIRPLFASGAPSWERRLLKQHFMIYLCREPKGWTLDQLWPKLKNWD
jgi:hypothetical protein